MSNKSIQVLSNYKDLVCQFLIKNGEIDLSSEDNLNSDQLLRQISIGMIPDLKSDLAQIFRNTNDNQLKHKIYTIIESVEAAESLIDSYFSSK